MSTFCRVLRGSAVAALVLVSCSAASAQQGTAEQRSACIGDAFRLCGTEIPDVSRITFCMKVNFSKLSPGCKAVFVPEPVVNR